MVIVNIKKEDSKKAFKKEAVFKVPKIKGYPTIRIEKGCDFQRNTNFSYSSQPLYDIFLFRNTINIFHILFLQNLETPDRAFVLKAALPCQLSDILLT